jgi:hypothetical protein
MIAIGHGTIVYASNYARFGNSATTAYQGWASWSTASDGRFKRNIQENVSGLAFINKLRPVTYTYDASGMDAFLHKNNPGENGERAEENKMHIKALQEKEKVTYTGFIAQEVQNAAKELQFDFSGVDAPQNENDIYALRYSDFVVPLVKAVQELSKENEELKRKAERMDALEKEVAELKALVIGSNNPVVHTLAYLEQNAPNPVSGTTTIRYHVPETSTSASLTLTNAKGQVVKTVSLNNRGTNQLSLNTTGLAAGTYNYTLYIDGKQASSKRLVITQ